MFCGNEDFPSAEQADLTHNTVSAAAAPRHGMCGSGDRKIVLFGGSLRKMLGKNKYQHQKQQLVPLCMNPAGQFCTIPAITLFHYSLASKQLLWTAPFHKKQSFSQMQSQIASGHRVTSRDEKFWVTKGTWLVTAPAFNAPTMGF